MKRNCIACREETEDLFWLYLTNSKEINNTLEFVCKACANKYTGVEFRIIEGKTE